MGRVRAKRQVAPVPAGEWVWCGYPGHFIGGHSCRFHLDTRVGDFRVSTVGDYHPIHGAAPSDAPEEIGLGRLYETFVFRVEGRGEHGEGVVADWSEVDSDAYNDAVSAEAGHLAMCAKYAG